MRAVPVLAMTVATGLASVANAQQQPTPAQPAAQAQQAPRIPRAAASTRASVQVLIDSRFDAREGGWFGALNLAGPAKISCRVAERSHAGPRKRLIKIVVCVSAPLREPRAASRERFRGVAG